MTGTENDSLAEKEYSPFLTNRTLSYFPDTLMVSNLMNISSHLDHKLQYSFLLNIVKPKKRFTKWVKKQQDDDVEMVMEFSGYNRKKAQQACQLLSPVQLQEIKDKLERGKQDVND